ncbi:MAG: helix-turn-helix domain-containing protein [Candidatus Omnitrophica bacterium]|nr:helix-turn-helix domain-containing protein [Candidatus Omnitrophota bacterium]
MNDKKYLSPSELAQYLSISIQTVYLWTSTKQIPFLKLSRLIRFDKDEIDLWMRTKKVDFTIKALTR